ncbi:MAG: hypothetical protein ACAI44_30495 [Candidatus Sericytochromatia bacterium]
MGLAQLQQALARLYTDESFRERFWTTDANAELNPEYKAELGRELGLSPAELGQLARLSRERLQYFADSLQQKRYHAVCKLLPHSHRLMPERFRALFQAYAPTYLPSGSQKHQYDAVQFAAYAAAHPSPDRAQDEAPWQRELLRYEALLLQAQLQAPGLLYACFRYPVWDAPVWDPAPLASGQQVPPTLCFWLRHRQGWHHLRVSLTFVMSIGLCIGLCLIGTWLLLTGR